MPSSVWHFPSETTTSDCFRQYDSPLLTGLLAAEGRECPVLEWAASGCMALTGRAGGPPGYPGGDVMGGLHKLVGRLARVADDGAPAALAVDPGVICSGRAALAGLTRQGELSAGGSARLWQTADGWVALNLARPADHDSVPALLGVLGAGLSLEAALGSVSAAEVVAAGELLGLAVSAVAPASAGGGPPGPAWVESPLRAGSADDAGAAGGRRLVVDLSSLWAGPLCAHLLGRGGARVVKVEHSGRLDGARQGDARFWRSLHEGHESLVVDFAARAGRHQLAALLARADVIIEASRGRALDQVELGPSQVVTKPGAVWVTITGYGRASARVAFGDDAAVAGGLVAWDDRGPMFCGDAMGDPVAGLSAAVAVAEALAGGGGVHLDVSMAAAVAAARGSGSGCGRGEHPVIRDADGAWWVACAGVRVPVRSPQWAGAVC